MTVFETIKERRSIRKFIGKPVERFKIKKIIDAARWAPSASNLQEWRFIVIDKDDVKRKIKDNGAAYFIEDAPILIVVLYDNRTENTEYQDYVQSASAAIQNMLLAGEEIGLGTCWVNNIPTKKTLRKILDIPSCFDPIAIVALGYYQQKPRPLERKYNLSEIISYNKFDSPHKMGNNLFLKRSARKLYLNMPKPIKKLFRTFTLRYEKKFDTEERYE